MLRLRPLTEEKEGGEEVLYFLESKQIIKAGFLNTHYHNNCIGWCREEEYLNHVFGSIVYDKGVYLK